MYWGESDCVSDCSVRDVSDVSDVSDVWCEWFNIEIYDVETYDDVKFPMSKSVCSDECECECEWCSDVWVMYSISKFTM